MSFRVFFVFTFLFFHQLSSAVEAGLNATVIITPAGSFNAKTAEVTGEATLQDNKYRAKDIKVNLKSIKTGVDLRDKHTQKYLETEKYPEATLVEAVGKDGKGKAKISFRGKEKIVEGTYKIIDNKFLQASFPIKLSDFDITGIRYMGVGVKDEVKVEFTIPFKKIEAEIK